MLKKNAGLLALLIVLAGCSENAGSQASSAQPQPCDLLTDALFRKHFDVDQGAAIIRQPSKYSPQPLCTASVPKPNAAELEQRQQAEMAEYLKRKMRGEDVSLPSVRTDYEVTLTLLEPAESADQAASNFDSAMRMLNKGVTGGNEEVEVTFQADTVPVSGIGDQAVWADKLHQLSVQHGRQIMHVTVNTGDGLKADQAKARAIASDLLTEL
jgi:hypothetical protein